MLTPNVGDLRDRFMLQQRQNGDDGFGNTVPGGEFVTRTTVWGRLTPLRGGEAVIASRLEGRQPYVLTIRRSSETLLVDEGWQVADARNPDRVFAVTAPPTDPDGRGAYVDLLLVEGQPS